MMMKLCAAYRGFALYVVWIISAVTDVKKAAFVDPRLASPSPNTMSSSVKFCGEGEAVLGGEGTVNRVSFGRGDLFYNSFGFKWGSVDKFFYHVILLVK